MRAEGTVIRAEAHRQQRALLIEIELSLTGRDRAQVNRQPLRRTRDLLGALQVTVFAPDDLAVVKGGPQGRREYLDDLLVALHPRHDVLLRDLDRVLRQRNTLLKQAGGRSSGEAAATLDVWDTKLAVTGSEVARAEPSWSPYWAGGGRRLRPGGGAIGPGHPRLPVQLDRFSGRCSGRGTGRGPAPGCEHRGSAPRRSPAANIGGLPSRSHASQGEQRSLALALRLAGHQQVTEVLESPPVLLLDDVFSELDPERSDALLASLPAGQVLLTTAGPLPAPARPEALVRIEDGKVLA